MIADDIRCLLATLDMTSKAPAQLIETHISWVILTQQYVYKIKKPVHFNFLDFSSQAIRKYYCEQEVRLNNRLSQGVYLQVVPIYRKNEKSIGFGFTSGQVIGHAVKMKRLESEKQMDNLLREKKVTLDDMLLLADQLATFHRQASTKGPAPALADLQADFADIEAIIPIVRDQLGKSAAAIIQDGIVFSSQFLAQHLARIQERHRLGFFVDGHGDLHSRNIFLLEEPIIFDCIEFNDQLRYLDILNELAFLCMDLEAWKQPELGVFFLEAYQEKHQVFVQAEDQLIFLYYKWYRANVRLKISGLTSASTHNEKSLIKEQKALSTYLHLYQTYFRDLYSLTPLTPPK